MPEGTAMARLYLIIIAVAAIAGAIFGKFGGPTAVPAPAASENPVIVVEKATGSEPETEDFNVVQDAVVLDRQPDGHFYADVEVNNMPIRSVVDTGASGIALSRDDARKAGLSVSVGMFDVVGEGASGDVKGEWIKLDSVKLGQEEAKEVSAVILDGGNQSLLGQSFLQQFSSVEIKGDRMYLR
jgi:aspartyl protease family protein